MTNRSAGIMVGIIMLVAASVANAQYTGYTSPVYVEYQRATTKQTQATTDQNAARTQLLGYVEIARAVAIEVWKTPDLTLGDQWRDTSRSHLQAGNDHMDLAATLMSDGDYYWFSDPAVAVFAFQLAQQTYADAITEFGLSKAASAQAILSYQAARP